MDTAQKQRIHERIRNLHRYEREYDRDIQDVRRSMSDWNSLKTRGWQQRSGEGLAGTAVRGGINAALINRQIKKERQELQKLYVRLHWIEGEIEDQYRALEKMEEESKADEERNEEEQRAMLQEVTRLRGELLNLDNAIDEHRQETVALYAQVEQLEGELQKMDEALYNEAGRSQKLSNQLQAAEAQLEDYRNAQRQEDRQEDRQAEEDGDTYRETYGEYKDEDHQDEDHQDYGESDEE